MKSAKQKAVNGFQIRGAWDWVFTIVSFLLFVALEGALLYAYFTFLNSYVR
jgi:hypothetical protein